MAVYPYIFRDFLGIPVHNRDNRNTLFCLCMLWKCQARNCLHFSPSLSCRCRYIAKSPMKYITKAKSQNLWRHVTISYRSKCAFCGYTADGKFAGDICPECGLTYWKCGNCGFLATAAQPPEACPQCKEKCDFLNVTCYRPECGGPGNIDPRL